MSSFLRPCVLLDCFEVVFCANTEMLKQNRTVAIFAAILHPNVYVQMQYRNSLIIDYVQAGPSIVKLMFSKSNV